MTHRSSIVHLLGWLLLGSLWLVGCAEWELPIKLAKRDCITPSGKLIANPTLLRVEFNLKKIDSTTIDRIDWFFGDSPLAETNPVAVTTTATASVTHVYTTPGTYVVVARLSNACQQSVDEKIEITVSNVVPPTVVTQEVNVLYTKASVKLNLTSNGNAPVTRYGVCWSTTNAAPTKADSFTEVTVASLPLNSPVTVPITGLQPNATYYFRAFAQNANTIGYGASIDKQMRRFPTFNLLEPINATFTEATMEVRLVEPGNPAIAEFGVAYSTVTDQPRPDNPNSLKTPINNPSVGVTQPVKLENLESGKRYWVRPYASTDEGFLFGPARPFDTPSTLTRDLVLYLPFADADGNPSLNDASGNRNNASPVGGPQYVNDGRVGKAIKFDGFNDYIFVPDHASLRPTNGLSVSLWIRPDALDSTMQIFNKARFSDSGGEQYSSKMRPNVPESGDVTINTDIKQGSGCVSPIGWQTFPSPLRRSVLAARPLIGNWNHIVLTFGSGTVTTYLNGELVNRRSDLGATVDDCPGGELKFGAQIRKFPQYFNGSMDEIRVYRRELTPDEVRLLNRL